MPRVVLGTDPLPAAAALSFPPDVSDPFSIAPGDFERDLAVNVSGAYIALHHATRGFRALEIEENEGRDDFPKLFIATGNVTPFQPSPTATTLGSGKAALAYLISVGAMAYPAVGYR